MSPQEIFDLTGPAVLLNIRKGSKAPTQGGWQNLTLEDMGPAYLKSLTGNIGVSLGDASGGLFSIDCDEDAIFQQMLETNPLLAETLQSYGARGGNFWVRIEGDAPKSGKLKDLEGRALGEWRGNGNQTILFGRHPSGKEYRNNRKRVITIQFEQIKWPDSWRFPWNEQQAPVGAPAPSRTHAPSKVKIEAVRAMLASIPTRPSYDIWLKVSAAVRHGVGDTNKAIELLQEWSPEEKKGEYAALLKSPFQEITFASLIHLAEENDFTGILERFFYSRRAFSMRAGNDFIPLTTEAAVRQHLTQLHVPSKSHNGLLCSIREKQFVQYIGPVAGLKAGLHECNNDQILVTKGPSIIEGVEGEDTFIHDLLAGLLDDPRQPEQLPAFLNWLAHARRAVINGARSQTPALALVGKRGGGKSLAIEIVKRCLGGRSTKAYRFFSGDSPFNADLIGSELLVIDDDAASKDHRSRVSLAQNIKSNLYGGSFRVEGKGTDAFDCLPVHALIMAVNDDPDHLRVLPQLDESMEDKIILLRARTAPTPSGSTMEQISKRLTEALPAFLYSLDKRDTSTAYDDRNRLKCFWNPEVIEALGQLSPERQFLEMALQNRNVSEDIRNNGVWVGTAGELEGLLTRFDAPSAKPAGRLLNWPNACGTFLGRLADTEGLGVSRIGYAAGKIRRFSITNGTE